MPFLRFSRDRRGYESTFVVHTFKHHGRSESRVLYWFRSPPHVRVGRAALDEEAIRVLEEAHPEVPFDWSRMLKEKPPPAPAPGGFEDLARRRRGVRGRPQPARPAKPAFVTEPAPRAEEERETAVEVEVADQDTADEPEVGETETLDADEVVVSAPEPEAEREQAPPVPAQRAGFFDPEILMRLRARYAELKARIAQRVAEPAQRDVLRAEAERLNPDTWVTEEEARTGLDQFERWFEAIRLQLPAPRRRRRRRKRGGAGGPPAKV